MKSIFVFRVKGGLGNQLFIYNMSLFLKEKFGNNIKILFDCSVYFRLISGRASRFSQTWSVFYILDRFFEIRETRLAGRFIKKAALFNRNRFSRLLPLYIDDSNIAPLLSGKIPFRNFRYVYLDGHWINPEFTGNRSSFRAELKDNNLKETERRISRCHSVAVHVRGKQYVDNNSIASTYARIDEKYYERALDLIRERVDSPVFFVFTNDAPYARKILGGLEAEYADQNLADYQHFYLMSRCRHHIIVNSTFSWWAAFMNNNSDNVVVCPSGWSGENIVNPVYDKLPLEKWLKA